MPYFSRLQNLPSFLAVICCVFFILPGCNISTSGIGGSSSGGSDKLVPEDSSSAVMKQENYQTLAVIMAKKDNGKFKDLLNQQPGIAKKTFAGKTLLFDAAFFQNKDAAQILLDEGADINFKTQLGNTATDSAISTKDQSIIDFFKQHGGRSGKG